MFKLYITGVKDGAGTSIGVEVEGAWRNVHDSPADPYSDQVDEVERRSLRVLEQRGEFDPLGLPDGAQSQRPREVEGLEAGQAVGESGLVEVLGLGQQRHGASAQPQKALRRKGPSGGLLYAAEAVTGDFVGG